MDFVDIYIPNPSFDTLGYIVAVANLNEKHDRSAPSDYHWKILKCRMVIFSHSSILACPDEKEVKQIHVIFNKSGDDYDKLTSLFMNYRLQQEGTIREVTNKMYAKCFQYTMLAKLAPSWNIVGFHYLINNRNFLTENGPQDGVEYYVTSDDGKTKLQLKPLRLTIIKPKQDQIYPGEVARVLPSLCKAVVEDVCESLPEQTRFKCYKDIKRHWKNIHGYRIPEQECSYYYTVSFWRGDILTYPQHCVTSQMPIVVPVSKTDGNKILSRFVELLKNKMFYVLRQPIQIIWESNTDANNCFKAHGDLHNTQAVSLCTPTQYT